MAAIYQNVWAQGDYIYHTTPSGIDVYNDDASSRISFIDLPAFEEERRQVVVFNEPTPHDNYPAPVTLSGSDLVYLYSLDGDDIHFQDMSNNELDFWVENWTYSGISDLWVKVPTSGTTSVYIYFDHDADISYGGGAMPASVIFYDDFSVVYQGTTGLGSDWTIPAEDEPCFLVSDGKLRVTGQRSGPGVYADAFINIDKGYRFQNPIIVETSLTNVYNPGGVPSGYNQFAIEFTGGSQERDLWGWYIEGAFNQIIRHNDDGPGDWVYGSNIGMTDENSLITAHFEADYTRIIAARTTNSFDITYSGTNRAPEPSDLRIFSAHDFAYDVNYVKITRPATCSGTISGTISSVFYPIIAEPTSVWANDDNVYIGTTIAGVYSVPVSTISGASTVTGTAYKKEPNITSNNTVYLHGADDYLCVSTEAGVDRYNLTTASGIYTNKENIHKCFQTTSGTVYYIENTTFLGADDSPTVLGDYLRNWKYYQHLVFIPTTQDNAHVRVVFQLDFPYGHTKEGSGDDIRFIDDTGNNLDYYVEEWYPNAIIIVNVAVAGTSELYMLYGNSNVTSQSSVSAYYFYDDFTDLSNWSVYKGSTYNYAVITDGYLDMYDYNNSSTAVVTNVEMPYSMYIKARIRRNGGTSTSQMDALFGYRTSPSKERPNAGYSEIDVIQSGDEKLHYLHAVDTAIQGTVSLSPSWSVWEATWSPGYQKSIYGDEVLERTSTNATFDTSNYFMFHIDNSSNNPNLNVDWISFESWPLTTTYTTTEELLWPLLKPRLHVVYAPTENWAAADYVYEEFYGDPFLLNDIHITEGTSSYNNDNTIFLATDRGAHVIDEHQGDEENADTKRYYIS